MTTRAALVAEALSWAGTPFHLQASVKQVGCDCKGLIWGIARELGMPEAASIHARMANYAMDFSPQLLRDGMAATFRQTKDPMPGDLLLIVIAGGPRHLAMITMPGRIIHTYQRGPGCVIEVPIGSNRVIDSYWTWPSIEDA